MDLGSFRGIEEPATESAPHFRSCRRLGCSLYDGVPSESCRALFDGERVVEGGRPVPQGSDAPRHDTVVVLLCARDRWFVWEGRSRLSHFGGRELG